MVLSGGQRSLLAHPDFKLGNERPRSFTAHGKPLLGRFAVNAALDLEQHVDTTHSLAGDRRLSLFHQVDKLPPAVAPAGRFKDRSRLPLSLVELVVSIKGIRLHEAHIAGKMALRMLPGTTARVMERCRRWVFAAKRPVIANIGPDPASFASTGTVVSSAWMRSALMTWARIASIIGASATTPAPTRSASVETSISIPSRA